MARITENSIEKVRLNSDIIQTISDYIELKKKGHNFFGLCPFHNEKTPSFSAMKITKSINVSAVELVVGYLIL